MGYNRRKLKMKKVFCILITILAVMSSFNAFSSENNSTAKVFVENPQCVIVGNVAGELVSDNNYEYITPIFKNFNDYPVNVSWKVYAYNEKGDRCTVASGTTYVKAVKNGSTGYSTGYKFPTSGYSGFSLEMIVMKCD